MNVQIALYQPDIPQNAGTLLRLGACLNVTVHIIHPTGFAFSDKSFRRAAMDYADYVTKIEHDSFSAFDNWRTAEEKRLVLLTTKAQTSAYEFEYSSGDILLLGRESAGVPDSVSRNCDETIRIPMQTDLRSINVAVAAALVLGEAMRQTGGFDGLE